MAISKAAPPSLWLESNCCWRFMIASLAIAPYCDGFNRCPRPLSSTSFRICVCISGCRVITIKFTSTSRIFPGTPLLPAVGQGCGPAGVSHVYLKIGCGTPPGNMDGYVAVICENCAAEDVFMTLFMTLVRNGTITFGVEVRFTGSPVAVFDTTERYIVVPIS